MVQPHLVGRRLVVSWLAAALMSFGWLHAQSTQCVSIDPGTGAPVGGETPSLSADGRYVVFSTRHAYDVRDTWGRWSIYRFDRVTGQYDFVSLNAGGKDVNGEARHPVASGNGKFVVFVGQNRFAPTDTNSHDDIYRRNMDLGVTKLVSADVNGASVAAHAGRPSISGDGDLVAFESAGQLVPADTNNDVDVYVRRMSTDTLELVSATPSGSAGNQGSHTPALSADGTTCAFYSFADDLVAGVRSSWKYFARDLATGTTTIVSCDANGVLQSGGGRDAPSISADGRFVAFVFNGALAPDDTNSEYDVWVKDRLTGAVVRANLDEEGGQDRGLCNAPSLSADGRHALFFSDSHLLVSDDANTVTDVFVRDLQLGVTSMLSRATDGTPANRLSLLWTSALSTDGTAAVFFSAADNLAPGDVNTVYDVFLRERDLAGASSATYGTGLAGTLGIPPLVASAPPFLNATITLDLGNSAPWYTVGLFLAGQARAATPGFGGTILVDPLASFPFVAPPGTLHWPVDLPAVELLAGDVYVVQALLLDPGAPLGVALSNGLELVLGF